MTVALWYVGGTAIVLLLLSFCYTLEDRRGQRVVLGGVRGWLDRVLVRIVTNLRAVIQRFGTNFVRLLFHYGAHQIIKWILLTVRNFEGQLERLLRHNKAAARDIRSNRARTHLDEIADYKEATALNKRERNKLLKQ